MPGPTPRPVPLPHLLLGVYVAACIACMTWPVYAQLGARIEPRVLGLPFSFAWVIGLMVATFAVMCFYHHATTRRG